MTKQFYIELAAREDIIANLIETASNFTERLGNSQDRIKTKPEERYLWKEVPGLVLAAIIEDNSKFDQTEDHTTTSNGGKSASSISEMASTGVGFSGTSMTGIETTNSGGTEGGGATTVSDGITSVATAVTDTDRTAAIETAWTAHKIDPALHATSKKTIVFGNKFIL